jgi:hypothetical protein
MAAAGASGAGAGLDRDEVDFDVVAFEAAGVLDAAAFGVVISEAAAGLSPGAVFAAAATFGAAGAFDAAGAFAVAVAFDAAGTFAVAGFEATGALFSTGAFFAAGALEGAADLRVAFGPAAGSAGVDPVDGVDAVASASLFAEAPLRGRLFDVIASWSPRARPCARTRARRVELRPVAALSVVGRARRVTRLKVRVGTRYVRTCRVAPHPGQRISTISLLRLCLTVLGSPAMAHPPLVESTWP